MRVAVTIFIAFTLFAAACSREDSRTSVPRRYGYPRIELPDSTFRSAIDSPVRFEVNDAATVEIEERADASTWLTIDYPKLNARIYCTISPVSPETLDAALDNRIERISLNVGANDLEITEFRTPNGFENRIFTSRAGNTTPVQFLATDGSTLLVSGAAHLLDATTENADSLQPVVDMLQRDVLHSLKTLAK